MTLPRGMPRKAVISESDGDRIHRDPKNIQTQISMRNKIIRLFTLALAGLFLNGCASNSAIVRVNQPERSLVIVPVKGQPICVRSIHTATVVGLGIIGGQVEQAIATGSSEALCVRLNQDTNFDGERILAEECASLLKASPKVAFHDVTVAAADATMSGIKSMEPSEQQRFKVNCPNIFKWNGVFSDWEKSPPIMGKVTTSGQHEVFLEVVFNIVVLNHHNRIQPASIYFRLLDSETGEMIGFRGCFENFDINKVTATSDLKIFEADFRKCMKDCARKILGDFNLL